MDQDACGWCGNAFVRIHARKRKWCSDSCKAAASHSRAVADGRASDWYATTRERARRQPDTATCPVCAIEFERRNSGRVYCSTPCRSKAYHAASYERAERKAQFAEANSRRRARKRGVEVERFTPTEIYERDGWICKLCSVPLDRNAKVPAYLAPTLDHIVPLAAHGPHTRANVQAAHFICNSRKSDHAALEVVNDARTSAEAPLDSSAA